MSNTDSTDTIGARLSGLTVSQNVPSEFLSGINLCSPFGFYTIRLFGAALPLWKCPNLVLKVQVVLIMLMKL